MLGLNRSRSARRFITAALLCVCAWLSSVDSAWAKKGPPQAAEPAKKSYSLPYGLVILGVALGVIVVTRPNGRLNEPKLPVVGKDGP